MILWMQLAPTCLTCCETLSTKQSTGEHTLLAHTKIHCGTVPSSTFAGFVHTLLTHTMMHCDSVPPWALLRVCAPALCRHRSC
jgi:hypothetical protein